MSLYLRLLLQVTATVFTVKINCIFAVGVKWQLHFEFLISRTTPSDLMKATTTVSLSGSNAILWKKEEPVTVDTMTWDLPVNILPTWPEQAEPLTQTQQHSLI